MNNDINYLFVYGTLLKNFQNEMALYLKENSSFVGKGYFSGKLYDVGEYPGAVFDESSGYKVHGNIFRINNINAVLNKLDEYEEVGDNFKYPNEYKRELIEVISNGEVIKCWVYLYNWDTSKLPQIISGDYLGYTNKNVL